MRLALPSFRLPPLRYLFGGIALYLVFLLATAPASLLNWVLPQLPRSPLALGLADGTLWSGEAGRSNVTLPNGLALSFDRVKWRFAPLALLRAEIALHLNLTGAGLQAQGVVGRSLLSSTLQLRDCRASAPASFATQFMPALEIWKPSGSIELETEGFRLLDKGAEGKATVRWKDAAVTLSPVKPLGSYVVNLEGNANGVQYQVSTTSGSLQVEGRGTWSPEQAPKFLGTARAQKGQEAQLVDLLRLMGRDEGNGVFRMSAQ